MNIGRIEDTIFQGLFYNEPYCRKALPRVEADFFRDSAEKLVYQTIKNFVDKYDTIPSPENLTVVLHDTRGVTDNDYQGAREKLGKISADRPSATNPLADTNWLLSQTNTFIKENAAYNVILMAEHIHMGENKEMSMEAIPELLREALAKGQDDDGSINMATDDPDAILARLRAREAQDRFPFQASLSTLNAATRGGLRRGETALMLAGSGVGKTKWLCNLAAQYAKQGFGVLYVNLESEELDIWSAIVANVIGVASDEIHTTTQSLAATHGLGIMVEDLMGATPAAIPGLIHKYQRRNGKKPDVVIIDYLAEMSPNHINKNDNTYQSIGRIYHELLDVARTHKVLIWSAAQFNREGVRETKKKDGGKASVEHIGDSYQQVTKATLLLKLELFHTEGSVGYMNAKIEKYRHNNDWCKFQLELQYGMARFREMSPDEWAEVLVAKQKGQAQPEAEPSAFKKAKAKRTTLFED